MLKMDTDPFLRNVFEKQVDVLFCKIVCVWKKLPRLKQTLRGKNKRAKRLLFL